MKKGLKIALISIVSIIVIVVVGVQPMLNSSIATSIINKTTAKLFDGATLEFSDHKISLWKQFPVISVSIDSTTIIYFSEDKIDTLASLDHIEASVDAWKLLFKDSLVIKSAYADGFTLDAINYGKNTVNWDIFAQSEKKDSSNASFPTIVYDRLLIKNSLLSFNSLPDTLQARLQLDSIRSVGAFRIAGDTINITHLDIALRSYLQANIADNIHTDLRLDLDADARGIYSPSSFPDINACLRIPSADASYKPLNLDLKLLADIDGKLSKGDLLDADIHEFKASIPGLDLELDGDAQDLLGRDPRYNIQAQGLAQLDKLLALAPNALGISKAEGQLNLQLNASTRQSQLEAYRFDEANITGHINSSRIALAMPADSLDITLTQPEIELTSSRNGMQMSIASDSVYLNMGHNLSARIRDLETAGQLSKWESNGQQLSKLQIATEGESIFARMGKHRVGVRGTHLALAAQKRERIIRPERQAKLDSLRALFPEASSREIAAMMRPQREQRDSIELPNFLKERAFAKADLKFAIDSSLTAMLRRWQPSGHVKIDSGFFASPIIPLRTRLNALHADFNEESIVIDTISANIGTSNLNLKGNASGLRNALRNRGVLEANLIADSRRLNINELISALSIGEQTAQEIKVSDNYDESFVVDSLENTSVEVEDIPLIVVPANLRLAVDIKADKIDYSDLDISDVETSVRMRERVLQLTHTKINTNLGKIGLDAFYSTVNKEDIKAGFNLALEDMPVHDVISIVPSVDNMMPALKSFYGDLSCDISLTSQLDTNMNFIIPSLDGLVRIRGENLEVKDAGDLKKITRLLLFKNKNIGHIDNLKVDAMIHNSVVEVFPFELGVDRYKFALRGTQNFDKTMHYHVSVLQSPFLIRFGINIFGNLDDWRFSLGRAKYKEGEIFPHTKQVDTVQVNLISSIRNIYNKGVDNVMKHNETQMTNIDIDDESHQSSLLSGEEFLEIDDVLLQQEILEQEELLMQEVDAALEASLLDTGKLMNMYQESIFDEKIARKMERLQKQRERKAKCAEKKAERKAKRLANK